MHAIHSQLTESRTFCQNALHLSVASGYGMRLLCPVMGRETRHTVHALALPLHNKTRVVVAATRKTPPPNKEIVCPIYRS